MSAMQDHWWRKKLGAIHWSIWYFGIAQMLFNVAFVLLLMMRR